MTSSTSEMQKAWALIPRNAGGRLHVVRVLVAETWSEMGAAYVHQVGMYPRGHYVPFSRLASTLPRLRAIVRANLGKHEKSASSTQAGGLSTQAAA